MSDAHLIFISALTFLISSSHPRVSLIFLRMSGGVSGVRRVAHMTSFCLIWIRSFSHFLTDIFCLNWVLPRSWTHLFQPFLSACWLLQHLGATVIPDSLCLAYSNQLRSSRKSYLWPHGGQRFQPERRGQLCLQPGLRNGGAHACSVPGQPPVEPPASNV